MGNAQATAADAAPAPSPLETPALDATTRGDGCVSPGDRGVHSSAAEDHDHGDDGNDDDGTAEILRVEGLVLPDDDETQAQHAWSRERENRWRLEEILMVCERDLQKLTQQVWDAHPTRHAALAKSLPPFQRPLVTTPIDTWDVSMCTAVLRQLNGLKKKRDATAVGAIVEARNLCAHAVGGRITTVQFEHHADACMRALTALGGDVAALKELRTCEIDASAVGIVASSQEATKAAESEKQAGNRFFREANFEGARERYTRGLLVPGAVDQEVRAQLYNNRATANIRLQDFSRAKEDAKHAAELAPLWGKPHLRLAEIYYETHKYHKAVARLEIAQGHATAAKDAAVLTEVKTKLAEYRLARDKSARREGENLAHGPMFEMEADATRAAVKARLGLKDTQDPMALFNMMAKVGVEGAGMGTKKHVILGQLARQDGRLMDAAREFMAAAVAGDPEGMYNYAVCQLNGRGTRKNIADAAGWLEKAAEMPITDTSAGRLLNVGIGEAMSSLGELYDTGVHFQQDKSRALKYWQQSAELNTNSGLNNLGLCLMNGSHGVKRDLPRARELFRRSAEQLFNPAMSNLGVLHASLLEFETAARWADAAFKFGFLPAANEADRYRQLAKELGTVPQPVREAVGTGLMDTRETPELARQNEAPTLETLRAIDSPYGHRLYSAKQLIVDAMQMTLSSNADADTIDEAVHLAIEASRIDDCELVLSQEEIRFTAFLASLLQEAGVPLNADIALLSKPSDASSAVSFWISLQRRFPNDLAITKKAACMLMFTGYAGSNPKRGVELFQRAFSLLPRPNDDRDPHTLDLLYLAGVAYFQTNNYKRAKNLLSRFLQHAPADGHRKGAEADYILGVIAMGKAATTKNKGVGVDTSVMARHLREGDILLQRVPAFLRGGVQDSPHRRMLQRITGTVDAVVNSTAVSESTPSSQRRGGELVDGPRRHEGLRSDTPSLQPMWRKEIAAMATASRGASWSTSPPRKSTGTKYAQTLAPATIDELFSGLADRVYTSRVLKCIAVSLPSYNGSSHQFVVEDSQREPTKIAVYNAPQSLIAQLVPGRAFDLKNPYVRIAQDGSVMLRVDSPAESIEVGASHVICWVCSVEEDPRERFKRCAKCHKAVYCSKACQTHDWTVDGHRVLCKTLRD